MTNQTPGPAGPNAPPQSDLAVLRGWGRMPGVRLGMVVGLLILVQIPLAMVHGLISERSERQAEVLADFQRGWGAEQTVAPPGLVVPYAWTDTTAPKQGQADAGKRSHGWAFLGASHLRVDVRLQPEQRRRGLFHATVFEAAVALSGSVAIPPAVIREAPDAMFDWANARVATGASDLRGMAPDAAMDWDGKAVALSEAHAPLCGLAGLDAPAGFTGAPAVGAVVPFKAALTLRGTRAFWLAPNARDTQVQVASPWPTPSFNGAALPLRYRAGSDGFDAQWALAGRPGSLAWQPAAACSEDAVSRSRVGVVLQDAVPTYLMVERAAKYGTLFLVMAFLTLFLFETMLRIRISIVQYGLVGLSVSLFALLLISVAEPLGFALSYAVSAGAVLAQASLYTWSVVRRPGLAAVFAGVLGALFAFLYVVLSLDSFALLAGTAGLFVALSAVMAATRRTEWAAPPPTIPSGA